MKGIQWNLLLLSTLGAFSIIGIGFSIGAQSLLGVLISIILLVGIMGIGFVTKKKMREAGKL